MKDYLNEGSKEYFETVLSLLDELNIPYEIDDNLVRGLDYYTHTVFEIVSINKEMGAQSTVLAGGRYDGLISYFGGPDGMSGIGWALGIERILLALEAEGVALETKPALDAYVMCLDSEARSKALQIVTELRAYGYRSDMDMLQRSFKAQFKAVDRAKAKVAILIGNTEVENNQVTIKDLKKKEQTTVDMEDMIETLDHILMEEHDH